jgi:hypothetical protein
MHGKKIKIEKPSPVFIRVTTRPESLGYYGL